MSLPDDLLAILDEFSDAKSEALDHKVTNELTIDASYWSTRINDITIAMSYSSRADPGLRVAFKCLNV